MGGYIIKTYTKFVHKEDACPSNCPEHQGGVCSSYNTTTKDIKTGRCSGHYNVNSNRSLPVAQYGPGSVIHHTHPNMLRNSIRTELSRRCGHVWYSGKLSNLGGSDV